MITKTLDIYFEGEVKEKIQIKYDFKDEGEIEKGLISWGTKGIQIDNTYFPPHKIRKIILED